MRQRASIGALLLVVIGVVLGATVFRSDIAQATGLAQSVTVNNTATNPVPVREQNLDGSNIRVHEEATAKVNVTNSPLSVREAITPVTIPLTFGGQSTYTVPDGKQLTIRYVNGQGESQWMSLTVDGAIYHLHGEFSGSTLYYFDKQVTINAAPGDVLSVAALNNEAAWLNGYLSDA